MEFTCQICGKRHDASNISFGARAQIQWELLSNEERAKGELCEEQCVLEADDKHAFFVRACLEIPIRGRKTSFTWGVWVSLSEKSFLEMADHWEDQGRTALGPYFGWLCTRIPEYPDTVYLKTRVHQRAVG